MHTTQIIILAGGFGERLWPGFDSFIPKQFVKFLGQASSFQNTLLRNSDLGSLTVMLSKQNIDIAREQMLEIGVTADIIVEPDNKSTAPCAIIAALYAKEKFAENVILLPVDHYIRKKRNYIESLNDATKFANKHNIVTLGIKPNCPNVSYGYLKVGERKAGGYCMIDSFVEKPNLHDATLYIADSNYYWNSGIFVFKPDSMIGFAKKLQPDMYYRSLQAFNKSAKREHMLMLDADSYKKIKANSIDYAFMEKKVDITMRAADFIWKDIGTWESVWEVYPKDLLNNVIKPSDNLYIDNVSGSLIHADQKPTAIMGVKDLVVVDTKKSLLVMDKRESSKIRKARNYLKASFL